MAVWSRSQSLLPPIFPACSRKKLAVETGNEGKVRIRDLVNGRPGYKASYTHVPLNYSNQGRLAARMGAKVVDCKQ